MNFRKIIQWPFFPFLLILTAIIDISLAYFYILTYTEILITMVTSLVIIAIIWFFFLYFLKDINKTSLVAFFFSVFLFEFQSVVLALRKLSSSMGFDYLFRFWNSNTGQWALLGFFLILVLLLTVYYKRTKKINPRIILFFNLISVILLVIGTGRGAKFVSNNNKLLMNFYQYWDQKLAELPVQNASKKITKPDIYYVILDGFGRSDVLQNLYGMDSATFLQGLEERGFFIADSSYSNYNQTTLSLASSLNMMYLDDVASLLGEKTYFSYPSIYMIENSIVEATLKDIGYSTVGFYSESVFPGFKEGEFYYQPKNVPPSYVQIFLSNTALSVVLNAKYYDWHRNAIAYTLDTLPEAAIREGPQFIFAHILCPHPPFIFNSDGTVRDIRRMYSVHDANRFLFDGTLEEYRTGYKNQTIYLQNAILNMVDRVKQTATEPFILILQGDHGPGSETNQDKAGASNETERHGIFYAIYFFDGDYSRMYPEISPVNTFRVIFSQFLGINEPLLEDLHYSSTYGDSYNFISVDDQLR